MQINFSKIDPNKDWIKNNIKITAEGTPGAGKEYFKKFSDIFGEQEKTSQKTESYWGKSFFGYYYDMPDGTRVTLKETPEARDARYKKTIHKTGGLKDLQNYYLKNLEAKQDPRAYQKDFGDYKLLVRKATKKEMDETPLAEVIPPKALPAHQE